MNSRLCSWSDSGKGEKCPFTWALLRPLEGSSEGRELLLGHGPLVSSSLDVRNDRKKSSTGSSQERSWLLSSSGLKRVLSMQWVPS